MSASIAAIMLAAGPALAGLIAAVPGLGLRACYLLDAVSFACSLYGVARLPAPPRRAAAARPGPAAVAAGVRYIGRSTVLAGAFLADLTATVFGLPVALFPAINAERFGGNPRTLGLFMAAIGVGGLVSGALSGPVGHVRPGRAMLWAVAVWGAGFAGFAVARTLWLTLAMLAVAGAAGTFTVVFRGTIVQQTTPEEFRGRVTAADYVVGLGGGQLGNLEAAAVGSLTSPTVSALAGGLATIAGAVVISLALPAFARYRAQPHPRPQHPAPQPGQAQPGQAQPGQALPHLALLHLALLHLALLHLALLHLAQPRPATSLAVDDTWRSRMPAVTGSVARRPGPVPSRMRDYPRRALRPADDPDLA